MGGRRLSAAGYDLMYRYWAPWDAVGVREELREVLGQRLVTPDSQPRVLDLGCGTRRERRVLLAREGFEAWGVDLSRVALGRARERARAAGVADRARFGEADLTAAALPALQGSFDFLLDFGTLDDLRSAGRRRHGRPDRAPVPARVRGAVLVLLRCPPSAAAVQPAWPIAPRRSRSGAR